MDFDKNMGALFDKLKQLISTETVIGDQIVVGNITLIPVISVSFGAGSGVGGGKDPSGTDGEGQGGGAGGKISPNAIIIIKDDEVSVVPISGKGSMEKIVAMVPEIVSQLKPDKQENNEA